MTSCAQGATIYKVQLTQAEQTHGNINARDQTYKLLWSMGLYILQEHKISRVSQWTDYNMNIITVVTKPKCCAVNGMIKMKI